MIAWIKLPPRPLVDTSRKTDDANAYLGYTYVKDVTKVGGVIFKEQKDFCLSL